MSIRVLSSKTAQQVYEDVDGFAARYTADWDRWLASGAEARPAAFGQILRRWQATRPRAMRRLSHEAQHDPPFLDELIARSAEPIGVLAGLTVLTISARTSTQERALSALWDVFLQLPVTGAASCVGITKAVLLLTDGRIGPALDSQVMKALRVPQPATCREWIQILEDIGEDITEFERACGSFAQAVPPRFAHLEYGRLYDMALGPR